jgi:hydroxymethylpyrimidine pyrophosphatase-like HAD family hydrolase
MKRLCFILAALAFALNVSAQDFVTKPGRMDRSRLNIGVYHLRPYARTEAHIKDLADCGIDFVICMEDDRPALDLFSKYGVGAIVSGIVPGWWGGDGDNAGKLEETNPLSKYEEAAASFKDHPAIWGIDIGDEPSALDFPYYAKVMTKVEELFPNQFAFLNLYPNYASVSQNTSEQTKSQLGTATYSEHIAKYCEYVPADYISYDFYYKSIGVPKDFANLRVVSDACLETGRGMWVTVQVNSNDPKVWITENELRFQAYSALAFGAENLTWACYTAGWWNNQVVDEQGNKTQQYEKLKRVNAELHFLGKDYMKYTRRATTFVGFEGTKMLEGTGEKSVKTYSDEIFKDLSAGCPLIVGEMEARDGGSGKALFVCVSDDPYDKAPRKHTLRFKAPDREISVRGGKGYLPMKRDAEGWIECSVSSNQGVLIEAAPLFPNERVWRQTKKLIAFDLDGTLTQHKQPLSDANRAVLDTLAKRYEIIMAGAGNCKRIYNQMGEYPITIVGNYGMEESRIVDGQFKIVREEKSPVDREFFDKECMALRKKYGFTAFKGDGNEYHDSGMVTFALLGTKADQADKLAFDPDKMKRRRMYPEVMEIFKDYSVFIGGTTSFDITPKQYNKYDAVMRYAAERGYTEDQVLFVGDDFDDGGNDSQVRIYGMDYVRIYDYTRLPEKLHFLF